MADTQNLNDALDALNLNNQITPQAYRLQNPPTNINENVNSFLNTCCLDIESMTPTSVNDMWRIFRERLSTYLKSQLPPNAHGTLGRLISVWRRTQPRTPVAQNTYNYLSRMVRRANRFVHVDFVAIQCLKCNEVNHSKRCAECRHVFCRNHYFFCDHCEEFICRGGECSEVITCEQGISASFVFVTLDDAIQNIFYRK